MTKYNFDIATTKNIDRLTNQLWKLIPMRENKENWQAQLASVLIELTGMHYLFNIDDKYLILLSKLEGLSHVETEFMIYRKTIFEAISLVREIYYEQS